MPTRQASAFMAMLWACIFPQAPKPTRPKFTAFPLMRIHRKDANRQNKANFFAKTKICANDEKTLIVNDDLPLSLPDGIAIRTEPRAAEVAWFSALCADDYEFLGVPDGRLRSSYEHCGA